MSVGWWRRSGGRWVDSLPVGSMVLSRLPDDPVAAFVVQRGLLKRVGAVPPP